MRADGGRPRAPSRAAPAARESHAVARSVTLSVPDLERSRALLRRGAGPGGGRGPRPPRPGARGALGAGGRKRESLALWADDIAGRAGRVHGPARRPWPPGYRISDQGLLNIAFGFRERAEFEAAHRRCREAGLRGNGPPVRLGAWSVVYVNDEQGFSVELLHVEPWYEGRMGFGRSHPEAGALCGANPARLRRRGSQGAGHGGGRGARHGACRLAAEDGTSLVLMDRDGAGLAGLEPSSKARWRSPPAGWTRRPRRGRGRPRRARSLTPSRPRVAGAGLDRAQSLLSLRLASGARRLRGQLAGQPRTALAPCSRRWPCRGAGHVTAIASLAGLVGMPYEASYSANQGGSGLDRRIRAGRTCAEGDHLHRGAGCRRIQEAPVRHRLPRRARAAAALYVKDDCLKIFSSVFSRSIAWSRCPPRSAASIGPCGATRQRYEFTRKAPSSREISTCGASSSAGSK